MRPETADAFADELAKMAGLSSWLYGLLQKTFSKPPEKEKAERRVAYFFSPKAGPERWRKFGQQVRDPGFVEALTSHPEADKKMIMHANAMHRLSRGDPVGKVLSSRLPGRSYEIKKVPDGLACTCPDWKYKGSVAVGYECKHIKAHKAGEARA
jgi:hypothetical protein